MRQKGRTNPPLNEIDAVVSSIVDDFTTEVVKIGEEVDKLLATRLNSVDIANREVRDEQQTISKARLVCIDMIVDRLAFQLRHGIIKAEFQARIANIVNAMRVGGNLSDLDDLYRMKP